MNSLVPRWVHNSLRCPLTHAPLEWTETEDGSVELVCTPGAGPRHAYPVENGVPILLANEARLLN
ncbi:Trm112 family protein [Actinomycetaceae bacterium L2_0104]